MTNKFFMLGSDPEVALVNFLTGELVSAQGVIPGNKQRPHKTANGSIQPDNIFGEFNIHPADNVNDWVRNHQLVIGDLQSVIQPFDLQLEWLASVMADESLLADPETRRSGCEPDFCIYNQSGLTDSESYEFQLSPNRAASYESTNMRAAGGHVHISFDQSIQSEIGSSIIQRAKMVRALDLVLGIPSIILDSDKNRRVLYGKAGSFRPKSTCTVFHNGRRRRGVDAYDGLEYRTLSNFWLKTPEFMAWVFNQVKYAYENLELLADKAEFYQDKIVSIINSGNEFEAAKMIDEEGLVCP